MERRPEDGWVTVDAWRARQIAIELRVSMFDAFAAQLGTTLEDRALGLVLTAEERQTGRSLLETFGKPYKTIVCARHSTSCHANLRAGAAPNKCFPNAVWREVAEWLFGLGYVPLAVGAAAEADDPRYADWPGPRLYGAPLRMVAGLVAAARAVVCVDTGLRFVAAATGCDLACVSGAVPLDTIFAPPSHPDQRIVERNLPVSRVDAKAVRDLVWPIL